MSGSVAHFETYAEDPAKRADFYRDLFDQALTQAEFLGGVVLRPKTAVPKTAWYARAADAEGNIFANWQTDPWKNY